MEKRGKERPVLGGGASAFRQNIIGEKAYKKLKEVIMGIT
jgi:hypothetical protein